MQDSPVRSQCRRLVRHERHARAERCEPRVGGLTLDVAEVDLLDDDGDLEDGEDFVETDA